MADCPDCQFGLQQIGDTSVYVCLNCSRGAHESHLERALRAVRAERYAAESRRPNPTRIAFERGVR